MNGDNTIYIDAKNSKFIIRAPFWYLDVVRAIPNRRWHKPTKTWTAPVIRKNAEYLKKLTNAVYTAEGKAALEYALTDLRPKVQGEPFPADYVFKTEPMAHQRKWLDTAWNAKLFALHWKVGTGKTKFWIDLLSARWLKNQIESVLVVCPNSVRQTWADELEKHCPLDYNAEILDLNSTGGVRSVRKGSLNALNWFIAGIDSIKGSKRAQNEVMAFMKSGTIKAMVVDESSKIKSHDAIRSKLCVEIGKQAEYRYTATGTPIPQGIEDLYMQFEFLDPNIIGIGDWFSFRNRHIVYDTNIPAYPVKIGYQNVDELMEVIRPFVSVVETKEALPDLPPKVYERRYVELSREQQKAYKEIKKKLVTMIDDERVEVKNVLEKMLRMHQIVGGNYTVERYDAVRQKNVYVSNILPGPNPKIEVLLELLEEIDGKVVVWCRYSPEIGTIAHELRKKYGQGAVVEFHGGVPEKEREVNKKGFLNIESIRFCVANAATGGIGINEFVSASTCVYFSCSWSSEEREQSEGRLHRMGQQGPKVTVIDLVAQGTVDEIILEALERKQDLAQFVQNAMCRDRHDLTRRM